VLAGVFGCGCAWLTGRAIAQTWRPLWNVAFAMLLIAIAVRFLHFALFQEPLLAPRTAAFEFIVLLCVGFLAWRRTRARQMTEQYYWLYEPNGPLGGGRDTIALSERHLFDHKATSPKSAIRPRKSSAGAFCPGDFLRNSLNNTDGAQPGVGRPISRRTI
jgi:hypothetical protein